LTAIPFGACCGFVAVFGVRCSVLVRAGIRSVRAGGSGRLPLGHPFATPYGPGVAGRGRVMGYAPTVVRPVGVNQKTDDLAVVVLGWCWGS